MSIAAKRVRRIEMNKRLRFIIIVNRPSITNNTDEVIKKMQKKRGHVHALCSQHIQIFYI